MWNIVYKDKKLAGCLAIDKVNNTLNNYLIGQYGNNRNIVNGSINIDSFIWNLCVHSDYRSNGFGKDLIKKSIKKICENNKDKTIGLTIKENSLLKFYKNLGFTDLNSELPIVMIKKVIIFNNITFLLIKYYYY